MPDDHDTRPTNAPSPVERLIERSRVDAAARGELSRRARQTRRSLEDYLKAGNRPRWMERLAEIDQGVARELRRLERTHRALRARYADDKRVFADRWRATAEAWSFDELNELIRQHNDWYPIERQLPMDPRTRDYVLIHGRSYRREPLGPEWVLEQFPAT